MNKRIYSNLIICLLAIGIFFCSGCAKQPSAYVPTTAYAYDDSQDVNVAYTEEETLPIENAEEESVVKTAHDSSSTATVTSETDDREISSADKNATEDLERKEIVKDHEGNVEGPEAEQIRKNAEKNRQDNASSVKDAHESAKLDENRFGQIIDENTKTGDIAGTDMGTRTEQYPDEDGQLTADSSEDTEEQPKNTEKEISQPEEESQKEKDDQGKGDDSKKEEPDDGNNGSEGKEIGSEKETEKTLDPEKVVSLSYEGELGTYIWGEAVDLANLTVTATFEDGHQETVTDYVINMNYPALLDTGVYTYERTGPPLALDNYVPGTYNAYLEYKGVSLEVPYRLIIMYAHILVEHRLDCKDPEGHQATPDEYGHLQCKNRDCGYPDPLMGSDSWVTAEGHLIHFPLLYDYVLTSEDIYSSSFFTSGVNLGAYYFEGFPAVYDKNSGTDASGYGPDRYSGTGGTGLLIGYDYREFRGGSPMNYGNEEVETVSE